MLPDFEVPLPHSPSGGLPCSYSSTTGRGSNGCMGVMAGFEAIVNSVSHTLEFHRPYPDTCWTWLLDFRNAFNSINRTLCSKR